MFGETVRAHRRRLGMSQEDLSGKARIGVRTIRDIEAGRSGTPRPATLRLLAEAFGLHGPERERFHELAHHRAASEATASTTEAVDAIVDRGAVEGEPHQAGQGSAAAWASPPRSGAGRRETGDVSAEGFPKTRSGVALLARREEASMATTTATIADHRRLVTAMAGLAHGGWLSFESAARRLVPAHTMRLAQGIEALDDRHSITRHGALWVSAISAPAVVLALYLFAIGKTGQSIAILAIPLGIPSVALIMSWRPRSPVSPATRARRKLMIVATAVVLGAVLPGAIWWGVSHNSDLGVELGSSFQLADGDSLLIEATPAGGEWEGRLTFTPLLVSNSVANDCVLPTWLTIAPQIDGQILDSKRARHGQPVSLPIPASTREVGLRIEYTDPGKQGCVVTVTLSGAALER